MNRRCSDSGGRLALAAALAVAAFGAALPAHANVWPVTNTQDLVNAVAAANQLPGPHTINLAPGLYTLTGNLALDGEITLNGGPSPGSVIDGSGTYFIIEIECGANAGPVTLNDLTLQNGAEGIRGFGCVPLRVNRCTITGMSADGLYGGGSPTEIVNSTFSDNNRAMEIDEGNADLIMVNVTVAHNGPLGGVFYTASGNWTMVNSLFADNHWQTIPWDCQQRPPDFGSHNLDTSGTCGPLVTQVPDALVGPLSHNGGKTPTVALLAGSPAIDAGTDTGCPGGCPTVDQRSLPRGTAPDIGAYEYGATLPGNTPTGTNVSVSPVDSTTGTTPVTLVFATVTAAGDTTLTISASGPAPPAGFAIGQPPVYFDLETTATFTGAIQICIDTTGIALPPNPQLMHFDAASNTWQVITVSFDPATGKICGQTNSLSPFAVMGDVEPPVISTPSGAGAEATGPNGAAVSYSVSVSDNFDPHPTLACAPGSGSVFPLGTTAVGCTAADASGNQASDSFPVTVVDTTPPVLTLPAGVTAQATSPEGATVSYQASASDLVSGTVVPVCTPPSGSLFPIGSTTVTCRATDAAGNVSAPGSFVVVVTAGPQDPFANLIALVGQLVPAPYQGWLIAPLHRAQHNLAAGHTHAACIDLQVFVFGVRVLGHWAIITPSNAGRLIDAAQAVALAIGCGPGWCH